MLTVHYAVFLNFLGLCLTRKPTTTSVSYSIPRVNNAPLFVITGIDAFPDKKRVTELSQAVKRRMFQLCSSFS